MCDYCKRVLEKSSTIPHKKLECQFRRSMYCPVCASYGHQSSDCPNKEAWAIRKGLSCDPLPENIVLKVRNTEEGIKEVLKSHGIQPGSRILENRKLLRDMANSMDPPHMIAFTL